MKFHCKDFSIQTIRVGSRLRGGPEWGYKIVYTDPATGRDTQLRETFYRKSDARKEISRYVKRLNSIVAAHNAKTSREAANGSR